MMCKCLKYRGKTNLKTVIRDMVQSIEQTSTRLVITIKNPEESVISVSEKCNTRKNLLDLASESLKF